MAPRSWYCAPLQDCQTARCVRGCAVPTSGRHSVVRRRPMHAESDEGALVCFQFVTPAGASSSQSIM
eukprot:4245901-Pyramimonas_sp.AAC.1